MSEDAKKETTKSLVTIVDPLERAELRSLQQALSATSGGRVGYAPHLEPVSIPATIYGPVSSATVAGKKISLVQIGGTKVNAIAAPYLVGLIAEAASNPTLGRVTITSGYRDSATQKKHYDNYQELLLLRKQLGSDAAGDAEYKERNNTTRLPNLAAKPGKSLHQQGLAIDFAVNGKGSVKGPGGQKASFKAMDTFAKLAQKFYWERTLWPPRTGLSYPEPWHYEFSGTELTGGLYLSKTAAAVVRRLIEATNNTSNPYPVLLLRNFYLEAQAGSNQRALGQLSHRDHVEAYNLQLGALTLRRQKKNTAARQQIALVQPDELVVPEVVTPAIYDFGTGLWSGCTHGGNIDGS